MRDGVSGEATGSKQEIDESFCPMNESSTATGMRIVIQCKTRSKASTET